MGLPHFHSKNPVEFRVWCTMVHRQGFSCVYTTHIDMLTSWWAEALQSVNHVDACRIHGKTNVTWWHGSRQSHCDDYAHNIAWICSYDNRFEHISTLQGQKLSWLERVVHIAKRVHHTKCTIIAVWLSWSMSPSDIGFLVYATCIKMVDVLKDFNSL